jgi:serine/threonine protein kinase
VSDDIHSESESTAPNTGSGRNFDDQASAVGVRNDPLVGTILDDRFEIEEVLGTGGAGVVYKAKQLRVNRHVAIKTIRMQVDSDVIRERFQREINSLCVLNHPNIVTVYDCIFGWDGQPYVVMDYLKGLALDALLKRDGAMDLNKFARIALQIVSALDHAHKKGIVHRDLKPGNIVLIDDDTDIVKVVDFGLAKLTHDRSLTKSGELWGSPPYMSPEQAQGEPSDTRSDIYSLGTVMYEMLTGKDPFFEVVSVYELIQAHVSTPPPKFAERDLQYKIPFAVEDTIMKCLEKKPEDRFQSVAELQSSLVEALSGQLEGASRDYLLRFTTRHVSREPIIEARSSSTERVSREQLAITQKDPSAYPAKSQPVSVNSRFKHRSGPDVRWIPWTIAACSMLLALSLGVVVWNLLDRVQVVPPPAIADRKPNSSDASDLKNSSVDSKSLSKTPLPAVTSETSLEKPASSSRLAQSRKARVKTEINSISINTKKKPRGHATANIATPKVNSAKPNEDPWKTLSTLRKNDAH